MPWLDAAVAASTGVQWNGSSIKDGQTVSFSDDPLIPLSPLCCIRGDGLLGVLHPCNLTGAWSPDSSPRHTPNVLKCFPRKQICGGCGSSQLTLRSSGRRVTIHSSLASNRHLDGPVSFLWPTYENAFTWNHLFLYYFMTELLIMFHLQCGLTTCHVIHVSCANCQIISLLVLQQTILWGIIKRLPYIN